MKTPDNKLTLKLKRDTIARAKVAAKKRGTSVSRMVEEYFDLTAPPPPMSVVPSKNPIVDSLVAMARMPYPRDKKFRAERAEKIWKREGYMIVVRDDSWVTSGELPIVSAKDAVRAIRRRP